MFSSIIRELWSGTSGGSVLDGCGVQADKCSHMVGPGSVHPLFLSKDPLDDPYSQEYNVVRLNGSM